ncbi:SusC/RagA family TonB-linked outer membrane protein [Dysgonomonas capnocytophagoides]|uniref:SusC/RagA family TonB-linked outer membrane protein n=1 Tax=Dysgonomonas capnocytophagoides TaxID=45254 RepID=UPI0030C80DBC
MKKLIMILTCIIASVGLSVAQTTTKVSGTIVDDTGETVIGASVVAKGTTVGTVTDVDGKFSLNIPSDKKTLVISLIGLRTKEVAAGQNLRIVLENDSKLIDEVMVVAYGTTTKSTFTGSASVVKSDAMEKIPASSFEKTLQGASPGLQIASSSAQPGSETTVRIRGIGSITGDSSPLYVIDGVPIASKGISRVANDNPDYGTTYGTTSNPLAAINPNDIESVTVLKDASAAALYGSRAANGVIIITTKKGASGEAKIAFRSQWSYSKVMDNGYDLMSGSEHYKKNFEGYMAINGGDATAANTSVQNMYRRNPYNVSNPLDAQGNLTSGAKLMIDTDWMDELYRTAGTQDYNLDISGGNTATKYFVSMGYMKQDGTVIASDFERYSGRVNLNTDVKKWMQMGVNSNFAMTKKNTPPGGGGGASPLVHALNMPNAVPVYDLDSDFNLQYDAEGNVMYNYTNPLYNDMNVIGLSKTDKYFTKEYRAFVSPWIDLKFFEGFSWRTSLTADYQNLDEQRWYNREHGNGAAANGRLGKYAIWNFTTTLSSILTYDFKVNQKHHFNVLAGFENVKDKYNYQYAQATGFPVFDLIELGMGATPQEMKSQTDRENLISYLSRVNYDYDGKYYASFSFRRDGSSRFGANNKYGNFWSVGGSWRMTQEKFMEPTATWLTDAKLRASYGVSGSKEGIGKYASLGLFDSGANYNGQPGISHLQAASPDLSWEEAKTFNVGVDFNIKSRITGSLEFYNKNSSGLLLKRPLALSSGLTEKIENIGKMRNTGIEFELTSMNIKTSDFEWETGFNITHSKNKITSYPEEQEIDPDTGTKIRTRGYSVYEFYMQEWAGVDQETGSPLWYKNVLDENGNPTGERETTNTYSKADRYKLGTSLPSVFGGLTNTFRYKGFDLSFLFTYSFGGKIYDANMSYLLSDGNRMGNQLIKEALDSWTPENKFSKNPLFVANNTSNSHNMSSRYLYDADYIKFRNLNIGYTLPSSLTKKFYVDNLRVYAGIDNVFIWNLDSNFKGYDVEQGGVDGYLTSGGTVPPSRTYLFGISLNF